MWPASLYKPIFILDRKEIGLYRDDGLVIIERKNNQDFENKKKKQWKYSNALVLK